MTSRVGPTPPARAYQTTGTAKQNRFVTGAVASVALIIGLAVTILVMMRVTADNKESLVQRALTAAAVLDRESVARLAFMAQSGDTAGMSASSELVFVREQLQAIRVANRGCRFVYLLGEIDGNPVYLADAEDVDSPAYSSPGESFGEVPAQVEETLRQGRPYVTGPALNQFGVWVSAFAPIRDAATGDIIAVLGIDVAAQDWVMKSLPYGLVTAVGSALILVLLVSAIRVRQKESEAELLHYASHDFLTDLPNRYALELFLKETLTGRWKDQRSSIAIVDIDHFKVVNDSFTHAEGDRVLVLVAGVVKSQLREQDFIARLGGDEFAIVFPGTPLAEAREIVRSIRESVQANHFSAGDRRLDLTVSIGLAQTSRPPAANPELTLSRADMALFAAKRTGRNKVVTYDRDLEPEIAQVDVQRVIPLIKNAILAGDLVIHLQPIVHSTSGDVSCYEVLSRIRDQDGTLIYPGVFLPVAEQFGLISELDRKVVRSAIEMLEDRPNLRLFVNLSQASVGDADVLEFIKHSLDGTWIDPSRLGFEISETAAFTESSVVAVWVGQLKALGCPIALDDFGAGYSSFLRLGNMPVDVLKIDGSFVRDMDVESSHKAFVQAMNDMAHAVGKKTVAEFVENERIQAIVKELGVDFFQGYSLGKPAPLEEWHQS
ncbi:MAG: putative bifunctional diguanylate cyclase/phosphodiesterase [Bacillota bacterium]